MRSLQSGVILISLVAALASYSVSQQNVAEVVKQSSDAVVLIVISNSAGGDSKTFQILLSSLRYLYCCKH